MRNLIVILLMLGAVSCQVLDKREMELSKTFCKSCQQPLKKLLLDAEGIYVVKYVDEGRKVFINFDEDVMNVDSLELVLMKKGYLPRKDSIVMHPVCCNQIQKEEKEETKKEEEKKVEEVTEEKPVTVEEQPQEEPEVEEEPVAEDTTTSDSI